MQKAREPVVDVDECRPEYGREIDLAVCLEPRGQQPRQVVDDVISRLASPMSIEHADHQDVGGQLARRRAVLVGGAPSLQARDADVRHGDIRYEVAAPDALLDVDRQVEAVVPRAERVEVGPAGTLAGVGRVGQVADRPAAVLR